MLLHMLSNSVPFNIDQEYGGNGRPGWVLAGDMNNDGHLEIVAGGGYALYIYETKFDACYKTC